MTVPWSDCKVVFDIDEEDVALADRWQRGALPDGWTFLGTDGTGARRLALFRVDKAPTARDGERVLAMLTAPLANRGAVPSAWLDITGDWRASSLLALLEAVNRKRIAHTDLRAVRDVWERLVRSGRLGAAAARRHHMQR